MNVDVYSLPPDLPVPEDDGACDGLIGMPIPATVLQSSQGPVDLAELARERLVLYVYPRSGRPDAPLLPGWDEIPGARGCTPQSCAFRDHAAELAGLGARVAGLSAQTPRRPGGVRRAESHAVSRDRATRASSSGLLSGCRRSRSKG